MPMTRLVGDVHGKYEPYKRIIKGAPPSIQVGDMGVGFRRKDGWRAGDWHTNPPHAAMVENDAEFIRGNHDNLGVCRNHSQYIADGTVRSGDLGEIMFVGGAVSIDRAYRTEGYDWWADEELSTAELNGIVDKYLVIKPAVMITHECPEEVAVEMERLASRGKLDPRWSSRTRQAFQSMWSAHSPKLWVFGHWHRSFDYVLNGTRFICLAELEYKDLEI